ncbi:MAG: hypothetical protein JO306_03815 [Gemmatimonadetes bacterium]|nr:hypothetical protein [Gemmatimonadota bacterium]
MDLGTGLARCRACNDIFRYDAASELAAGAPAGRRQLAALPPGVTVADEGTRLVIRRSWFSLKAGVGIVLFTAIWNGMLLLFFDGVDGTDLFELAGLAIFGGVGVFLLYLTLAVWVNTTTITVDRAWLRVRDRPLPVGSAVDLAVPTIRQLYCAERTFRHRRGKQVRYELLALLRDGTSRRVMKEGEPDLLMFVEREAERWLKIADEPVGGELARY